MYIQVGNYYLTKNNLYLMRLKEYYDFILFAVYAVQSNISYSKNLNVVFKLMMYK